MIVQDWVEFISEGEILTEEHLQMILDIICEVFHIEDLGSQVSLFLLKMRMEALDETK